MKNRTPFWYVRLLIFVTIVIYLIGSYMVGWLDLFILTILLPVFLSCLGVIYVSLTDSPKSKILRYKDMGIAFAGSIGLLITFVYLFTAIAPLPTNKSVLLDRDQSTYCSWLPNVPINWRCYDSWDESTRYLTAYNPSDKNEYIQLQIEGSKSLRENCYNLYPIEFRFTMASYSGITLPMRCFGKDGLMYRADWSQDGRHFRLVGHNVDSDLFINNLNMYSGGFNRGKSYTTNDLYQLAPTTFTIGKLQDLEMSLTDTNLCREDNTLKEQIYLSLDGTYPIDIIGIKTEPDCSIQLRLRIHNLKPGTYPVISTVNGLTQQLKDKITLE
ncbi:hypothetical protein KBD69_04600 [Candidatus Woesebacteria bacterium]|nr:hypothetical protein [Candidatus Woesebacteria bacterium]